MTSETAYLNGGNANHHHQHNNYHLKPPTNDNSFTQSSSSSSPSPSSSSSLNNSSSDQQQQQQDVAPLYDPSIKYPLENSWSFWFYKGEKSKSWKENVKFITTVDYVEDFWAYENTLLYSTFTRILSFIRIKT